MPGTHYQDQFVLKNWKRFQFAINRFEGHQPEVDAAVQQLPWEAARHMSIYLHLHVRILLPERKNQFRQQIQGRAFVRSHADSTGFQSLQLLNCLAHLSTQTKNPPGIIVHDLACFSEGWYFLVSLKQW